MRILRNNIQTEGFSWMIERKGLSYEETDLLAEEDVQWKSKEMQMLLPCV